MDITKSQPSNKQKFILFNIDHNNNKDYDKTILLEYNELRNKTVIKL